MTAHRCLKCHWLQVRIHKTVGTNFFIFCGSSPIIEHTTEAGFGRYDLQYPESEAHLKVRLSVFTSNRPTAGMS